jgi:hypothetical protein
MRRTVVEDCWGVRWTVRARYDRHLLLESDDDRRKREPELRSRLGPALAPRPGLLPLPDVPVWGSPDGADDGARAVLGHVPGLLSGLAGPWSLVWAIWRGLRVLAEPTDRSWIVELRAGGRIRRGATWRAGSPAEAERILATVADAVRRGQVPHVDDTLLVDVDDERLTVHGAPR